MLMVTACSTLTNLENKAVSITKTIEEGPPDVCVETWLPISGWYEVFPHTISELTEAEKHVILQIKENNAAWVAYCRD